eukprot:1173503-Prorocentrum_minimum.AAC.2
MAAARLAPYVSALEWQLEPRLVGVPFINTPVFSGLTVLQLPVRLASYTVPNFLTPGKTGDFSFTVKNLTGVDYGTDSAAK